MRRPPPPGRRCHSYRPRKAAPSAKGLRERLEAKDRPDEIRKYFAQFGSVKRCTLPFNKETGFHKSFCWVGFSTEEGFKNALQKNTHILEGVKLDVQHQKKSVFPGQYSGRRIADTN
ncbi:SRA stem-loop-interacting RNA-binding protein, mitochondrial isoform X1 [Hemicordylus capensis]|uniref:SRA stem-loop-interacting RNA-binding protein, mitochondrial isoform X1 n=1 Tax=Hemicordylus capensis TaxID=884348 RepID=UPI00230404DC|nr:SRA stem-loop-interacting RNA-binding protein, mitochondrial isoform X1 [Hemicordylus capensis]